MRKFAIDAAGLPKAIRRGICAVIAEYPHRFDMEVGVAVVFHPDPQSTTNILVTKSSNCIHVSYRRPIDAFRALGRLMGNVDELDGFEETARLQLAGVMIDVSRNGAVRPDAMRAMLLRYALMGLNMVILYTEDMYELPGEPMFGYLRGRYSQDEIRALDEYAGNLGIEMFPCIQTLAHMASMLQWPAFKKFSDTDRVMLAEDEQTYAMIEKMIDAATSPYRSRRIHLGMDEARGIGTGRYKELHGEREPFEILNRHLDRVRNICAARGLKPMIWSDMYFRIGSATHEYYDQETIIPQHVVDRIPKDVQLVYWDYYHLDQAFYEEWIDRHRAMGSEPLVAGGVWTWDRFWAHLPYAMNAIDACMRACVKKGVSEMFMTMWADDGAECDYFSAMPALQYFAEHVYADPTDKRQLSANFMGSCDAHFDDWVRASDLDATPCFAHPDQSCANVSKFLLWQDPMLSIMDPHLQAYDLTEHYQKLADDLHAASQQGSEAMRLRLPAQLASVLVIKAHLRRRVVQAYQANDRDHLQMVIDQEIPELLKRVEVLWQCHRRSWMELYKPFGWEVIERRYGALMLRLRTLADRLRDYLEGRLLTIAEFDEPLQPIFELSGDELPVVQTSRVATPSVIK